MAVLWAYYEMGSSIMLENCNFCKRRRKVARIHFKRFKYVIDTELKETVMGNFGKRNAPKIDESAQCFTVSKNTETPMLRIYPPQSYSRTL